MILLLIVIFFIFTPFFWWYLNLKKYKSLDSIQGPKPLPIIGNVLDLGNSPQEFLKNCMRLKKEYGDIFKAYIGNELKILISRPELIESLLSSNVHITKSNAYDMLKPWIGIGLLTSTGKKWKSRRKMITPTFHFKILDEFMEIYNSAANILIDKLSKEADKESVDISTFINLHSLDVICETAMGVKINAQKNSNVEYVTAVRSYLDIFIIRAFSVWKQFNFLFRFAPEYPTYKNNLKTLHQFSNSVISKRREEKSKKRVEKEVSEEGIKRKTALLDMLLESENNELLTNEDIREEIDTFMFEGHDTTTAGMTFAVMALADHPEIQEKVYQEIQEVIGSEENITMQHLQDMKYLDMVIKETERLYPSVPLIERRLETDYNISGYDIPKETTLTMFIYALHRSEKSFPNPEIFDPNRFLPENQTQRHKFAYVPFSAGARNCIGQKFALLEMKVTIAKIVRTFEILKDPNWKPDFGLAAVLKSYNGVHVRLRLRK